MAQTVGRMLVESLEAHDIDLVYCVPGESYLGFTDALADSNRIRLIVCRHEGGASFMAAADGRMRGGRAGMLVVSRGPGMSNAMIGLHTAWHDATPLVVLVGQVERWEAGRMALQEQNYSRLLSDVTKLVIEVNEPAQASEALARAFHVAESGTPGPVAVVIPEDVFDATSDAPPARPRPAALAGPRPEDLDRLAHMLAAAERPLVWIGGAVHPADVADVARLAESWVLPVMPTHRRPHLFDPAHPNYGGYVSGRLPNEQMAQVQTTDLLVALGERLTVSTTQGFTFPAAPEPQVSLVHIWPGPEEVGRVWRADLAMACEPAAVVRALLARGTPSGAERRRGWVEHLHAIHNKIVKPEWQPTDDGVNFAAVVAAVGRHLDPDATVTTDAGNFSTFVQRYLQMKPGQMYLNSVVGAMGPGMPMAVAACLRRPGTQVIGFAGDGGALMTGNELATAQQYGVNPVFIIADNGSYGTITQHHDLRYPGRPYLAATQLTNPDFALWATAFGARAFTIRAEAEVAGTIAEALAVRHQPVVVHVHSSLQQINAWRRRPTG
ncbi:MAG TPA: thiamine pyrophosphate-dependent enzyme [Stellaceae bacterium]|nr:thiamine pyrophosphate-dependent enzyme [Stellaceae bacterium]